MANEGPGALRFIQAALSQTTDFKSVMFFAILDRATTDGSLELLRAYTLNEPRLRVVWAPENRGVVDAYIRGYREALDAGADWILEIDAGFSHDPAEMPKFWQAMRSGPDCVFGTRFSKGGRVVDSSWKRTLVSRGGSLLSRLLLGARLTDMTSGFELFTRDALLMVLNRGIQSRAHFFQTEIKTYCRNLQIEEVPITYRAASPRLDRSALTDAFSQLWRLYKMRRSGML